MVLAPCFEPAARGRRARSAAGRVEEREVYSDELERQLAALARTRCVQLVRGEGRDVSSQYGVRDEMCPVSTGGGVGARASARPCADRPGAAAPQRAA